MTPKRSPKSSIARSICHKAESRELHKWSSSSVSLFIENECDKGHLRAAGEDSKFGLTLATTIGTHGASGPAHRSINTQAAFSCVANHVIITFWTTTTFIWRTPSTQRVFQTGGHDHVSDATERQEQKYVLHNVMHQRNMDSYAHGLASRMRDIPHKHRVAVDSMQKLTAPQPAKLRLDGF